jgi:hypothetical protein
MRVLTFLGLGRLVSSCSYRVNRIHIIILMILCLTSIFFLPKFHYAATPLSCTSFYNSDILHILCLYFYVAVTSNLVIFVISWQEGIIKDKKNKKAKTFTVYFPGI